MRLVRLLGFLGHRKSIPMIWKNSRNLTWALLQFPERRNLANAENLPTCPEYSSLGLTNRMVETNSPGAVPQTSAAAKGAD